MKKNVISDLFRFSTLHSQVDQFCPVSKSIPVSPLQRLVVQKKLSPPSTSLTERPNFFRGKGQHRFVRMLLFYQYSFLLQVTYFCFSAVHFLSSSLKYLDNYTRYLRCAKIVSPKIRTRVCFVRSPNGSSMLCPKT